MASATQLRGVASCSLSYPCLSVPQWECKAQTDKKYQLGRIQVSCEGYDYPDDPYILRGSCGVSEQVIGPVWQ